MKVEKLKRHESWITLSAGGMRRGYSTPRGDE